MPLSQEDKKQFRAIGHHLKPVLMLGDGGASEGVMEELEKRLSDHELIKVKISASTREARTELIGQLCNNSNAQLIQRIGNMALLYRAARKPNPKLSNILRHQDKA